MRIRLRGWLTAWGVVLLVLTTPPALAASGDADGTYTVTVKQVEVSTDGTNFVTVFSGSSDINISAVDAGAQAATLVSGTSVPPGTYTTVRVTIGATLSVKGYINIAGRTHYTDGGTDGGAFSNVAGTDQQNAQADYAISTFTIPAANRVTSQAVTFNVVKGGPASRVTVTFDTSGVITNNGGQPSLGAPTVTMSSS